MAVCLVKLQNECPLWCTRHRVTALPSGAVEVEHCTMPGSEAHCLFGWWVTVSQKDLFDADGRPASWGPLYERPRIWVQDSRGAVLAAPRQASAALQLTAY